MDSESSGHPYSSQGELYINPTRELLRGRPDSNAHDDRIVLPTPTPGHLRPYSFANTPGRPISSMGHSVDSPSIARNANYLIPDHSMAAPQGVRMPVHPPTTSASPVGYSHPMPSPSIHSTPNPARGYQDFQRHTTSASPIGYPHPIPSPSIHPTSNPTAGYQVSFLQPPPLVAPASAVPPAPPAPAAAPAAPPATQPPAPGRPPSEDELLEPLSSTIRKRDKKRAASPLIPPKVQKKRKTKPSSMRGASTTMELPDESEVTQKKGRKAGATGYTDEEIMRMLKVIKSVLPLGKQSWERVTNTYNRWATSCKYSARTSKALRAKFDAICATKKPTGDAEVPPHVEMAWEIEEAITEKSGTIALSDSELSPSDDVDKNSSESEDNGHTNKKTTSVVKAYRANALLQPGVRRSHSSASDAMASLSAALSPATMKERDESKLQHMLQLSEHRSTVDMLRSELRDARHRVDELTDKLMLERERATKAESKLELAQSKLELYKLMHSKGRRSRSHSRSPQRSHYPASSSHFSTPRRHDHYSPLGSPQPQYHRSPHNRYHNSQAYHPSSPSGSRRMGSGSRSGFEEGVSTSGQRGDTLPSTVA